MTSAADLYFDPSRLRATTPPLPAAATGPVVVAYQGEPGAYSEQSVRQLFAGSDTVVSSLPCASFSAVFASLASGESAFAMVPIENSLGGSIHDNYDLQLRHNVTCVAELQFRVEHCLLALPGVRMEDLKSAYSHPQALSQCEGYLGKLGLVSEKQYDTAGSAKMIAEQNLRHVAAVASELAAETYGLQVLARNIEDEEGNYTRFLLLAPATTRNTQAALYAAPTHAADESSSSSSHSRADSTSDASASLPRSLNVSGLTFSPHLTRTTFKTSLVFTLPDAPGALFKALSVFALRDIAMCKIESRPCKNLNFLKDHLLSFANARRQPTADGAAAASSSAFAAEFKYLFFIDTLSSLAQSESLKNGLRHLKESAPFMRVLGSYPVFRVLKGDAATAGAHRHTTSVVPIAGSATRKLRIGIVGFGTFGQFLGKALRAQGHDIFAHSRSDYSALSSKLGITWVPTQETLTELKLDVLVLAVSILSFESTVAAFPWERLKDCLVVDVLSVKEHPKSILLPVLEKRGDKSLDFLATHPMFGPESGRYSWKGLAFMYDRVRVGHDDRANAFLSCFEREGCRMLEMTCAVHDEYAAGSQFLTHTTGRILSQLQCVSTPVNTAGYTKLLQVIDQTQKDSWELYAGLYQYNARSREQLEKFAAAFEDLHRRLLSQAEPTAKVAESAPAPAAVNFNPNVVRMNESKTVQIADLTKRLMSEGTSITSLSVGEVLSRRTPQSVIDAATKAMNDGHTIYTSANGLLELRTAICAKLQRENGLTYAADQIVVSNGAKQSIYQAVLALVTPEENEVIIPAPYWVSYPDIVTMVGGTPVVVDTADDKYILTAERLEAAITPRTKLLILCSPSNPTGIVYTHAQLEAIAAVLRRHPQVHVLSDEIYEYLLFDGASHTSFAALDGMFDRTITINGFSKGYVMTGFRVGYVAVSKQIAKMCNKIQGQITSCSSSVSQYAAIAALALPPEFRTELVSGLDQTRKLLLDALRQIPKVHFHTPNGAFYVLLDCANYFGATTTSGKRIEDSDDLAFYLLDQYHVALVPGSAFGAPRCLRISYASSDEIVLAGAKALTQGLQALHALQA